MKIVFSVLDKMLDKNSEETTVFAVAQDPHFFRASDDSFSYTLAHFIAGYNWTTLFFPFFSPQSLVRRVNSFNVCAVI